MKICPSITPPVSHGCGHFKLADLKTALALFEKFAPLWVTSEVMAELHFAMEPADGGRIAGAPEEFDPHWIEDPVFMDHLDSLDEVARATTKRDRGRRDLGDAAHRSLPAFGQLRDHFDSTWCGGLTEERKIAAAMATSYHVPVAAHDCTGPVARRPPCTSSAQPQLLYPGGSVGLYQRAGTVSCTICRFERAWRACGARASSRPRLLRAVPPPVVSRAGRSVEARGSQWCKWPLAWLWFARFVLCERKRH